MKNKTKTNKEKAKWGHLRETPEILVGKYSIRQMKSDDLKEGVYIEHEDGEGGQFRNFELCIEKFFLENL